MAPPSLSHPEIKRVQFGREVFYIDPNIGAHHDFIEDYGQYNQGPYADRRKDLLWDLEIIAGLLEGKDPQQVPPAKLAEVRRKIMEAYTGVFKRRRLEVGGHYSQDSSLEAMDRRWQANSVNPPEVAGSTLWVERMGLRNLLAGHGEEKSTPAMLARYKAAFFDDQRTPDSGWRVLGYRYFGVTERRSNYLDENETFFLRHIEYVSSPGGKPSRKEYVFARPGYRRFASETVLREILDRPEYRNLVRDISAVLAEAHSHNAPRNLIEMAFLALLFDEWQGFGDEDPKQDCLAAKVSEAPNRPEIEANFCSLISGKAEEWLKRGVSAFPTVIPGKSLNWEVQGIGPYQVIVGLAMAAAGNDQVWSRWKKRFPELNREQFSTKEKTMTALLDSRTALIIKGMTWDLEMTFLDHSWFTPNNGLHASIGWRGGWADPTLSRGIFYLGATRFLVQFPDRAEEAKKVLLSSDPLYHSLMDDEFNDWLAVGTRMGVDLKLPGFDVKTWDVPELGRKQGDLQCSLYGGLYAFDYVLEGPDRLPQQSVQTFCFIPTIDHLE